MISKHTAVPTPPPLCKGCQARCGRLRLQCGPSHSGPAFKGRAVFRELLDHVGGVGGSPRSPVLLPRCPPTCHVLSRKPAHQAKETWVGALSSTVLLLLYMEKAKLGEHAQAHTASNGESSGTTCLHSYLRAGNDHGTGCWVGVRN